MDFPNFYLVFSKIILIGRFYFINFGNRKVFCRFASKPITMQRLNYHEFYEALWMSDDFVDIISDNFIDDEKEFIKEWTYQIWRQYDLSFESENPMTFRIIKKIFSITFSTLASFSPRTDKIKPVSDNGRF